jgi:hypothetical protein
MLIGRFMALVPVILFLSVILLFMTPRDLHAVVVANVSQLENAVENANNGGDNEIILQDGTYSLSDILPVWANNVIIRSQSGKRDNVHIYGQGMYGGVTHVFNVAGTNFTARDMTIGKVSNHAIQIWGNNNSSNTLLSNLRIIDTYEQMVKISYDSSSSNSSKNGVMEFCLLEYTAGVGPQFYIGGIDGHQTENWTVRNNTFKYISSPSGSVAEHAVHFWSDSKDTVVENNLIIDCDRGIGFGLGSRGHSGGIIRNNMILHSSTDYGFADVAIGLENASNVKVYNNTVYFANNYPNAVEYRFNGTSGGTIANNLCNKAITSRDGGSATLKTNITNAQANWFVSVSTGDLHLTSQVSQVIDQGTTISGLTADYDGDTRPQGSGIDIGADEYTENGNGGITPGPPFGSFDIPVNGSTVSSSIPVSGWALDDTRVTAVKIYRNPLPGHETGLIYIGDATFITDARPDIKSSYLDYPFNDTAGWGYMMLTNFLPNNGNGTFTIYAVAEDNSGNSVTLGSKTITVDNANAVNPFGAIDTPRQGGTVSGGSYINWGWVLTPQPNSIATDGSTIDVWVDGIALGHPVYNLYRSDIASLFPGYANSSGAVGYFSLDTTSYDNGTHLIQWTATDTQGNTDGIGSRFFTVSNKRKAIGNVIGNRQQAREEAIEEEREEEREEIRRILETGTQYSSGLIVLKKGFPRDINSPPAERLTPAGDGVILIEIKQLEHIEVRFNRVSSLNHDLPGTPQSTKLQGCLMVGNKIKPLPVGSTLDEFNGVFYWQPGPGFIGSYRLIFTDIFNDRQYVIKVIIKNII